MSGMRHTAIYRRILLLVLAIIAIGLPRSALLASVSAQISTTPAVSEIIIGSSSQGRPISGIRIGNGPRKFALIGDTHGLPEANTYQLVQQLLAHFRNNPGLVPADVRLYIIPTVNPDGLALGTRFNARAVDLNRNMNTNMDACPENDWSTTVFGARGIVSDTGGAYADSEPESRVVRDFLLDASGVIFYHSNAGNVFPAFCEHTPSILMAQIYAEAGGYAYNRYWGNYPITGGMHDWAASLGISAIIPELISPIEPEFEQNLPAVLAVLAHASEVLPLPEPRIEQGIIVDPIIWRYWRMHGGVERFGPPLAPPEVRGALIRQSFTNTVLELDPTQADTPFLVRPILVGQYIPLPSDATPVLPPGDVRRYSETGMALYGAFAAYWDRYDGMALLGFPLSDEFVAQASDGTRRSMQIFERGVLAYDPEQNQVRLEPTGWATFIRQATSAATIPHQIR
jgi:hypothetical protein